MIIKYDLSIIHTANLDIDKNLYAEVESAESTNLIVNIFSKEYIGKISSI